MPNPLSKAFMAAGAAAALATSAIPKPAAADTASTIETLVGAAAVIGGIVLYNNYQHKKAQANAVVGYTRNGGTVYGDGRIVMPNGQTYYPNGNGSNEIAQYGYNNGYDPNAYGYSANPNGYNNGTYGYNGNATGYGPNQTLYYPKSNGNYQNSNGNYQNSNGYYKNVQNNGRPNANRQNNGSWDRRVNDGSHNDADRNNNDRGNRDGDQRGH